MILKYYDNAAPAPFLLSQCSELLRDGKVLILPTDTVYTICCDALSQTALNELAHLKGIEPEKSRFSILCADLSQASTYARMSDDAFKLIKANSPGPFTFILPTISTLPRIYRKRNEVGIRIPDHAFIHELITYHGNPLTGFSLPKLPEGLDIAYGFDPGLIHELYSEKVALVVDGGEGGRQESAIIDCTVTPFEVLREGPRPLI